jgi:hypothetical protein
VGTGLKARDFQLELTRDKRAQGRTYVDPKAGNELFGPAAEAFIASGAPSDDTTQHETVGLRSRSGIGSCPLGKPSRSLRTS